MKKSLESGMGKGIKHKNRKTDFEELFQSDDDAQSLRSIHDRTNSFRTESWKIIHPILSRCVLGCIVGSMGGIRTIPVISIRRGRSLEEGTKSGSVFGDEVLKVPNHCVGFIVLQRKLCQET